MVDGGVVDGCWLLVVGCWEICGNPFNPFKSVAKKSLFAEFCIFVH
jgi:hypothetical protein